MLAQRKKCIVLKCILVSITDSASCCLFVTMMISRSRIDLNVCTDVTKLLLGTLLRNAKTLTSRVCVSVFLCDFSSLAEGDAT